MSPAQRCGPSTALTTADSRSPIPLPPLAKTSRPECFTADTSFLRPARRSAPSLFRAGRCQASSPRAPREILPEDVSRGAHRSDRAGGRRSAAACCSLGGILNAGVKIHVILETTPAGRWRQALPFAWGFLRSPYLSKGLKLLRAVKAQVPIVGEVSSLEAISDARDQLGQVRYKAAGETRTLMVDQLLLHQGVVPNTNLSLAIGADHVWCDRQDCPGACAWTRGVRPRLRRCPSPATARACGGSRRRAPQSYRWIHAALGSGNSAPLRATGSQAASSRPVTRGAGRRVLRDAYRAPKHSAVRLATQSSAAARSHCRTGATGSAWDPYQGRTR